MSQSRRLAAILAADVAGYSRLIGADESGTLQALRSIRAVLIDPTIAAHNGRLVKTTGDGLLVEFGSVVDALRCASEVQSGMVGRNATVPADKRIEFRIGINMGDILVEDSDIFGDGVNVAARLEGLAEPGGICVSARVQEDATGKLHLSFEDLGEQALKNIARPVRAYRVAMDDALRLRRNQRRCRCPTSRRSRCSRSPICPATQSRSSSRTGSSLPSRRESAPGTRPAVYKGSVSVMGSPTPAVASPRPRRRRRARSSCRAGPAKSSGTPANCTNA
jgi:class 3 adenylate cyclase